MLEIFKRWSTSVFLLPLCVYFVWNRGEMSLLDNFHLVFHEPGHLIFKFFGDFIQFLGGTIMQTLMPAILVFYCYKQRLFILMQGTLFLLGHSFINISVYASDAQTMRLHLVGGGIHDWNWMLTRLNILQYDQEVGYFFFGLGILTFIACLIAPLLFHIEEGVRFSSIDELKNYNDNFKGL
jgi:hypothetical protein